MTFANRKGPDVSQIYRQTVASLRTGDSEGAVTDGCTTCGHRHQNFSGGRWTQSTTRDHVRQWTNQLGQILWRCTVDAAENTKHWSHDSLGPPHSSPKSKYNLVVMFFIDCIREQFALLYMRTTTITGTDCYCQLNRWGISQTMRSGRPPSVD